MYLTKLGLPFEALLFKICSLRRPNELGRTRQNKTPLLDSKVVCRNRMSSFAEKSLRGEWKFCPIRPFISKKVNSI